VRRYHASYQAQRWKKPRRVVAKVKWYPGELYPRVRFIVTNLARPAARVVVFYNHRGTAEQWIKEGKGAIKWTRLLCRTFAADADGPAAGAAGSSMEGAPGQKAQTTMGEVRLDETKATSSDTNFFAVSGLSPIRGSSRLSAGTPIMIIVAPSASSTPGQASTRAIGIEWVGRQDHAVLREG
jgi:hypothetical protein